MGIRNNYKKIRHLLQIDTKREMAELLGIPREQYTLFEQNRDRPQPSLETVLKSIERLRPLIPDIKMEDIVHLHKQSTQDD